MIRLSGVKCFISTLKLITPKCYLMNLSARPTHSFSKPSNYVKLYQKPFSVHPGFGKLFLKSNADCIIQPSCPQTYPDANFAEVTIWGEQVEFSEENIEAKLLENNDFLKIDVSPDIKNLCCEISIPIKYDIEADLQNEANLQIKKLESDKIEISTKSGSIFTNNIKSEEVNISTKSGHIIAEGALQGNINIGANSTTVKAKRLQGMELCIQADQIKTDIESSYMVKSSVFIREGDVNIKHLHGSSDVHMQTGKLFINGLHGGLRANVSEGEIEVQVTEVTEESSIQIDKGDLTLSFTDISNKCLDATSPSLQLSEEVKKHGVEKTRNGRSTFRTKGGSLVEPTLWANANDGNLKVLIKDWFSSLGIKMTA